MVSLHSKGTHEGTRQPRQCSSNAAVVPLHPLQDRNSMWHVPVPLYMPVYEENSTCQNGAQQPDNCNMVTWSVLNRNNAHVTKRVLKTTAPRNPRTRTEEPTHWMHSNFLSHGFGTRASLTWLRTYAFCHRLQYSGLVRLS